MNNNTFWYLVWLFVTLNLLFGCAGVSEKPTDGGLIGGVNGIMNGAYDRRLISRENNLDQLKKINNSYRLTADDLKGNKNKENQRISNLTKELSLLSDNILEIQEQTKQIKLSNDELVDRKNKLIAQLNHLQNDLRFSRDRRSGNGSIARKELINLAARRDSLQRELDLLIEYNEAISN